MGAKGRVKATVRVNQWAWRVREVVVGAGVSSARVVTELTTTKTLRVCARLIVKRSKSIFVNNSHLRSCFSTQTSYTLNVSRWLQFSFLKMLVFLIFSLLLVIWY